MNTADFQLILDSIRALFASCWPAESAVQNAERPDAIRAVWRELVEQGFAEICAKEGFGLEVAQIVVAESGRAGCPVPLIPTFVLNKLFLGIGDGNTSLALDATEVTYENGLITAEVPFVEHVSHVERIAIAVPDGICVAKLADASITLTPGLSVPALAKVSFVHAPAEFHVSSFVGEAALVERLLLASRALGAAKRAFQQVVEHVQHRMQFGQALARFQSMQHKLADCLLILDSAELLLTEAARRFDAKDSHWQFAAEAAIAFATGLRKVSLEIHHAFGAIGYAEEHEAPRHFRRVHADLCRLGGARRSRLFLARYMLEGEKGLPSPSLDDEVEKFRSSLRKWIEKNWTFSDRNAQRGLPFHERGRHDRFERALGAAGYLSMGWPKHLGGMAARPLCQMVLMEELERFETASSGISAAAWLLAPEIIRHGSSFLKEALLPGIASGKIKFALGYSEPEAGSDLTSLRTRAVRDGDHYVVTGQKLWGTGTEHATHIALAVRTDPDALPKAQGISVLIVPTDLPGITIHTEMALYGHTFCTQFYDGVRVPAEYLLGEENKGWAVLTGALAAERILMGGQIARVSRVFEKFCAYIAQHPNFSCDALAHDMIGRYTAEFEAARQLALRSVLTLENGQLPVVEGAITKIFSGELTERFCEDALDILGMAGTLGEESPDAPIDGHLEQLLRRSIMLVVGGGAAEIQKTIIAQRGLGLLR
jgi:3-oxo-4-pregnene-20-carboxyl-CoA dehydrogenase beta subunit